jgi:two-component system chemotaxis response regulator CheB
VSRSASVEVLLRDVEAVVIGASAGAVSALSQILPPLPADYPLPILIAVHLTAGRESRIAELLQSKCRLIVKEAEDKEPIASGTAYFAPPDYHLLVEKDRRLSLSGDEPVNFSRPSIDVLFESAADAYGRALLGIILTGANNDGARGLRALCAAGGLALVQTPASAEIRTMPEAALAACEDARAMSLSNMVEILSSRARLGGADAR